MLVRKGSSSVDMTKERTYKWKCMLFPEEMKLFALEEEEGLDSPGGLCVVLSERGNAFLCNE